MVLDKLSQVAETPQLHIKYKQQFIAYYKEISEHKVDSIRKTAVYNLPCMNLLYKSEEKEMINALKAVHEFEIRTSEIMNLVDIQIRVKIVNSDGNEQ